MIIYKTCTLCNKSISHRHIASHIKLCERVTLIKPDILNDYTSGISAKRLESKYNLGSRYIREIVQSAGIHRNRSEATKLSRTITPLKHTTATKEKLSAIRLEYLKNNPDKVPYLLNHSSKESYPEKRCRLLLTDLGITGWIQHYQHSIYEYDFAFPELKIDLEIDGNTHTIDSVKTIDMRRDVFSRQTGWTVIRFTAKEFQANAGECIDNLISLIYKLDPTYPIYDVERWLEIKPKLIHGINRKQCICGVPIDSRSNKCMKCYTIDRHANTPAYTELLNDLSNMSYVAVGRKYGVSDNAIRKWIRYYETHKT